jgi:hypothetical protein
MSGRVTHGRELHGGRWMSPEMRETANLMACAAVYFGLAAVGEALVLRCAAPAARMPYRRHARLQPPGRTLASRCP